MTGAPSWEIRSTFPISSRSLGFGCTIIIPAGGNISPTDFGKLMLPHPENRANYKYLEDGLLQAYGVVKDNEMRQPQNLDVTGEKTLFVLRWSDRSSIQNL